MVRGDRPVEVLGMVGPVLALVAIPGAELLDVRRVDRHCVGRGHGRPPANLPLGDSISPKGRVMSSRSGDDHDVLRHPRPAGRQAVDHPRARATGRPQPAPDLAARPEQAVRGAQEAGRPRLRPSDRRLRRPPPPNPLHDHRQGTACARRLVAGAGRRPDPRVRTAAQDQLRRQRQQGRHRRQPRRHPRLGASTRTRRTWRRHAPTSKAAARFPSAPPSTSSPAVSSPTST